MPAQIPLPKVPPPAPLPSPSPFAPPGKGVMVSEPGAIAASLKRQVDGVLATIPAGQSGALLAVATEKGVNVVVAHRTRSRWEVAAWIGRDWEGPLSGGVAVSRSW